jgi:hypothetical protein
MKEQISKLQGAMPVGSGVLGISIVTFMLIIIVAIGQWQIYPRLNAVETKTESLAKQLSQLKSSSQSSRLDSTKKPDAGLPNAQSNADPSLP